MPEELEFPGLPEGARLVRVGAGYRVIWDLGDDLGHAWYLAGIDQLEKVLGPNWQSEVSGFYATEAAFDGALTNGSYYWGDLAEVDITSEDPWEQLKDSIFAQFGPVAGLDNAEIRRLALQGFFESWGQAEFLTHYKQTEYYNDLNDKQRDWATLSDTERQTRIEQAVGDLLSIYRDQWGIDPTGGFDNSDLLHAAEQVASGLMTYDQYEYNQRVAAEQQEGTPAQRAAEDETQAAGQSGVDKENLASYANQLWRDWVGPGSPPAGWAESWAQKIFMNEASEADLEAELKSISTGRWGFKDENVKWKDWAAPWQSAISQTLELGTTEDSDPVLNQILSNGLTGQEAIEAIRSDPRFKETMTMRDELQARVSELGRRFGFIT